MKIKIKINNVKYIFVVYHDHKGSVVNTAKKQKDINYHRNLTEKVCVNKNGSLLVRVFESHFQSLCCKVAKVKQVGKSKSLGKSVTLNLFEVLSLSPNLLEKLEKYRFILHNKSSVQPSNIILFDLTTKIKLVLLINCLNMRSFKLFCLMIFFFFFLSIV